jgi:hypothetical protein
MVRELELPCQGVGMLLMSIIHFVRQQQQQHAQLGGLGWALIWDTAGLVPGRWSSTASFLRVLRSRWHLQPHVACMGIIAEDLSC